MNIRLHVMRALASATVLTSMTIAACHGALDVSDPTLIRDTDIANANGANARRLNVSSTLNQNAPSLASDVAYISDEWMYDGPLNEDYSTSSRVLLDRRDSPNYEIAAGTNDQHLGQWDQVYYQTSIAIPSVRAYTPDSLKGDFLAQLYAIRGYAALQIAEDICPGFPLNDVSSDNRPLFSGPLTTDSAVALASAQLDSAIKYVHDSTRFATLARVAKGRALLDQGKYAEAAAVVATVQTTDVYQTESPYNPMYVDPNSYCAGCTFTAVGNNEGGNGMPFVGAQDPRVPTQFAGVANADTTDSLYAFTGYTPGPFAMTLASGVEARLIEAEAAANLNDPNWLTILNTLRSGVGLPALADPGTMAAQIDLVYRERAFWLYLTGRRLGDLRRLIKNYGRAPDAVFPAGPYRLGGSYGSATSIPFILAAEKQSNSKITSGCTSR